jgi:glycosyltransferase involved in cell wall biosynthesis
MLRDGALHLADTGGTLRSAVDTPADTHLPTVSVVVPVLTHREQLEPCIRALEAQTYPRERYNVLVVDNGGILPGDFAARWPSVSVVREDKPGSYAARNRGIVVSRGEVVCFTDADCVPTPVWIEKGVARLLATANCGIVGGRIEVAFADPERPNAVEMFEHLASFRQREYVERWQFAATANLFTSRRVFAAVGGFDERLHSLGDREWGARVARAGYGLVYADEAAVRHPARRSLRALGRRSARVAGGFFELVRSVRRPVGDLYRDVYLGLVPSWLSGSVVLSVRRRVLAGVVGVFGFVVLVRCLELLRLSLGGRTRHR